MDPSKILQQSSLSRSLSLSFSLCLSHLLGKQIQEYIKDNCKHIKEDGEALILPEALNPTS